MAFSTRYGHFKYQVILFSLFNTLVSFQGYISKILTNKLYIFVMVYLNDILIYVDKVDHIELRLVGFRAAEKGFTI